MSEAANSLRYIIYKGRIARVRVADYHESGDVKCIFLEPQSPREEFLGTTVHTANCYLTEEDAIAARTRFALQRESK